MASCVVMFSFLFVFALFPLACRAGQVGAVLFLLKNGASPTNLSPDKGSILHFLAKITDNSLSPELSQVSESVSCYLVL